MKNKLGPIYVLTAGTLWGSMGVFVRHFNAAGLGTMEIAWFRNLFGLLAVGGYLLLFHRELLRFRWKDLWCFLGTGLGSLFLLNVTYYTAMQYTSLAVAGVLLYTAPIFVMLLSALFFRESVTRRKLLALVLAFAGCALVSGLGSDSRVSTLGLLWGLGAGLTYALYSIFSRFAIDRGYGSWTITFWSFVFSFAASSFFCDCACRIGMGCRHGRDHQLPALCVLRSWSGGHGKRQSFHSGLGGTGGGSVVQSAALPGTHGPWQRHRYFAGAERHYSAVSAACQTGGITMQIRKTTIADLPRLLELYANARAFMADHGNPRQWGATNWPPEALLRQDIANGNSYVCVEDDRIVGTFFYIAGHDIESTYRIIENGSWSSDSDYGVVHRIASDGITKGVGSFCLNWAYQQCGHLRIDTHGDNIVMQSLLNKLGFRHCGTIYVEEDNDPRMAYEKL